MGFYSPDQVLQDARRHGVEIRPVDVTMSDWDCTLEALDRPLPALRMGLRMIRGLAEAVGRRIQVEREVKALETLETFVYARDSITRHASFLLKLMR